MSETEKKESPPKENDYPKFPERWRWNKKFMMPKAYLYKIHVLLGYSPEKIAALHKRMLGVSVSESLVRTYLHKYGIYVKPPKKAEKKKKRTQPSTSKGVKYLGGRILLRRRVQPFLDSLRRRRRARVLNKFFRSMAKKKHITRGEMSALKFMVSNYPGHVSSFVIDMVLPNRLAMINWPRVEEIRKELKVTKHAFCKKTKLDICWYNRVQRNGRPAIGRRSTALRIFTAYRNSKMLLSQISKEVESERKEDPDA